MLYIIFVFIIHLECDVPPISTHNTTIIIMYGVTNLLCLLRTVYYIFSLSTHFIFYSKKCYFNKYYTSNITRIK